MSRLTRSDIEVYFVKQTAAGAIPANPAFNFMALSSGFPVTEVSYTAGNNLTKGRQGQEQIFERKRYAFSAETDLTTQTKQFLTANIHGVETDKTKTSTAIAITATGFTLTSHGFSVGDFIFASGATNALNNVAYRITAVPNANTITTSPAPAATESAGASITLACKRTQNGETQTPWAVQLREKDDSAAGGINYQTYFDGYTNSATLSIPDSGVITAALEFLFTDKVPGTALISGQTDVAMSDLPALSAVNNVRNFWLGGVPLTECAIASMDITVNNNYAEPSAAGCNKNHVVMGAQPTFELTASAWPYRADARKWEKLAENGANEQQIGVEINWADGKKMIVSLERAKITAANLEGDNEMSVAITAAGMPANAIGCTMAIFTNF